MLNCISKRRAYYVKYIHARLASDPTSRLQLATKVSVSGLGIFTEQGPLYPTQYFIHLLMDELYFEYYCTIGG